MVQSSESSPGQLSQALKKAASLSREGRGQVPPELLGIRHGHEDDPGAEILKPRVQPPPAETPED